MQRSIDWIHIEGGSYGYLILGLRDKDFDNS